MDKLPDRIICYGDSNTYGFDPRSFLGGRYEAKDRWCTMLAEDLGCEVVNMGQNGREIPRSHYASEALAKTFAAASETCQTLLLVQLGVNDILCGCTPETAARNMEDFLTKVMEQTSGLCHAKPGDIAKDVILISAPGIETGAWVDDPRYIDYVRQLGVLYNKVAKTLGIGFVDTSDWEVGVTFDGVHFSKEGNATFARELIKELRKKGENHE